MKHQCAACLTRFTAQHEMRAHVETCLKHPLAFALAANVALSEAIRVLLASAFPHSTEHPSMFRAWRNAEVVLAKYGAVKT